MYRRNGALWNIILNDARKDERFQQTPKNIQEFIKMLANKTQHGEELEIL